LLLSKGLEIEMYTGIAKGDIIGLSDRIVKDLDGFVREPDCRNVEYTTAPFCNYERLLCAILKPRKILRDYLKNIGDYTLIPGSTLSLGDSKTFYRSDPFNPYHTYIEKTYGTNVVTASIHINIGINDPEKLIQACRLIRVEAPLFLALSASSPFLDGEYTGYHSTRWHIFPQTPQNVPLFESHQHFIDWTEEQLKLKTMENVRHLWVSVRPNGDRRPYHLNRLELRICDLVANPIELLAIIALLEARLIQLLENPSLDPLNYGSQDLVNLTLENEKAVAKNSLDAQLKHWQDGRTIIAKDWVDELYQEVWPIAKQRGFNCFLSPLKKILREGNTAQKWLKQYESGMDIRQIISQGINILTLQEYDLEDNLCQPLVA
jgi:predicted glutamate--cysteine ligase